MRRSVSSKTGGVAQWLQRRACNPKTMGSIPWRSRLRNIFFLSLPSQLSCRRVCVPDPPSCVRHTCIVVRTLKIPYPFHEKRVGLKAGDISGHTKVPSAHTHTAGIAQGWVARLCLSQLSSGKATRIFRGKFPLEQNTHTHTIKTASRRALT